MKTVIQNVFFLKHSYLYIIITFVLVQTSSAQDQLSLQLRYADTRFTSGSYFDAITEYKRLLFFDMTGKYNHEANLKIGLCYKAGTKFDESIKYFRLAQLNTEKAEKKYFAKIQIVKTNILRRTTSNALQILEALERDKNITTDQSDEINYWRGWAYMFSDDWESASQTFAKIDTNHSLKILCDQVVSDQYSVTFAKVISYILPGSGQFYTGNYLSGLISLGWNVLWGYLSLNAFIEKRAFDGIAVSSLLWFRFYRGNFTNAEKFAINENLKITNQALEFLQFNYEGIKP
jgi:tetratricopeptide (TPR) repeat protein